jgi:signal transduction histidine kinase
MGFQGEIDMFSRTFDNVFVFNLFDLLLCGVIVLVIVRGWRARAVVTGTRNRLYLLLAFFCLGASFALGAIFSGAFLFFRRSFPESSYNLLIHALWASAWLMLIASAYQRPALSKSPEGFYTRRSLPLLMLASLWLLVTILLAASFWLEAAGDRNRLYSGANLVLDGLNPFLLALALFSFHRRPLGGHNFAMWALMASSAAALLHLASYTEANTRVLTILWNLEQFSLSLALLTFALAISEIGRDLFDRVFVGLQITFILLASLMILVITQTEKAEYLANIRARSDELAEFVRANVDYLGHHNETLPVMIEREDFLQRAMLGFGHIPELKIVRIASGNDVATFEIEDGGEINQKLAALPATNLLSQLDAREYFLIHSIPLGEAGPGAVEFYGTREILDRHIRKRIIIIFSLFTGLVVLSTFLIGLVVRGASATIQKQAREIEETQQQLMQASKLAAIGQLAAGVAHEVNNPATTILTRASFLLSEDDANYSLSDREDLEAIMTQAHRIADITNNLLLFSRPQVRSIKPTPIDRVVENSLRLVAEALVASHIIVEKEFLAGLPRAMADEGSLLRAFENLYRNAIDAMADGGKLRIRAARDSGRPDRLRIDISDNGAGIDKDNLAHIFDPFFTTKEVGKGTGLGLSIVHGIIKENQGTIAVESEPGKGTTFHITLPVEE